ncbi:MAG: hypothetical protein IPI72_09855 [Flavobacteriales bacterium]|nr:hypothetical protein [Flavobacteriales bacterium]
MRTSSWCWPTDVVEEGTHDRLIGQEGEYARMHQEQLLEEARKGIDL